MPPLRFPLRNSNKLTTKIIAGDAYERLAETTFEELEGDVKASIGSIELALKENSVKFAGLEGRFVESEDSANSKLAAALKKITDESIKLASGLVDELAVAVEEKLTRVDADIEDGRKRSMAIMAEAERSVNEKGEEEAKKAVEGGGSDRLSVISAKLNTGTSVKIMKNATAEAKSVIEISEKRVEMLNDEVKKVRGWGGVRGGWLGNENIEHRFNLITINFCCS